MTRAFTVETREGIATVTFDLPGEKVNILKEEILAEFEKVLAGLEEAKDLKGAVIVSGKPRNFIAGADLTAIESITDPEEGRCLAEEAQAILDRLELLPIPVVAAVNGACLGGGMELALACTFRIATSDRGTFFGLPETLLGILPGFGGTQRLPALVGLTEALTMITGGGRVYPEKALRTGLVDEVVEKEQLLDAAHRLLEKGRDSLRRVKRPLAARLTTFFVESNRYGRRLILERARKEIRRRVGSHYPAPLAAIDAVEEGIFHGREKGLAREARLLGDLAATQVCKNLVGVFRLRERFSRGDTSPAADIRRMGVIGAGVMGGGIAALAAAKGVRVRIVDLSPAALGGALGVVAAEVKKAGRRGTAGRAETPWIASRISYDTEMRGLAGLDFVVEAVAERMDVKKKVLASVTAALPSHVVTASNTSSLSIGEMSGVVRDPALFCGMHFFNPVDRMPLVEVVRGEGTSKETVVRTEAYARRLGKVPVVVRDRPGFLVNRLLLPYLNEGARLLEEGIPLEAIDTALENFGMPMGPFALLDMVGIDIASHAAENLRQGLGGRFHPSAIMAAMKDGERLGRKRGRGFYLYNARGDKRRDPGLEEFLSPHVGDASEQSGDSIADRLVLAMVNEASLCLEEEVVESAEVVDVAMILGAGFPPFTGGLLRYADSRGTSEIVKVLENLSKTAGDFFKPSVLIRRISESGRGFYGE